MLLVFGHNGQHALATAKARLRFPCRKRPQFCHWLVVLGDHHFLTRAKFADNVWQCRLGFFYTDIGQHQLLLWTSTSASEVCKVPLSLAHGSSLPPVTAFTSANRSPNFP